MSGKRLGAKVSLLKRDEVLDDNLKAYSAETDPRRGEGRVQWIRLDQIKPSPFQIRRVFPEREIDELADSIRQNGLIHEPRAREHPSKAGWVELMPGEMRLRALRRLVERGEAGEVLRKDAKDRWLAPVMVVKADDDRAEAVVFAENDARTDITAWEWALAWMQRRDRRRERGEPSSVRDVAAAHGKPFTTVGEYIRVAERITPEIAAAAGVVSGGETDHGRLAQLSFSALKSVAAAAQQSREEGALRLLQELRKAGDHAATSALVQRRTETKRAAGGKQSFQINIRQPLESLSAEQAWHYIGRMTEALSVLRERTQGEPAPAEAAALARQLKAIADTLPD